MAPLCPTILPLLSLLASYSGKSCSGLKNKQREVMIFFTSVNEHGE